MPRSPDHYPGDIDGLTVVFIIVLTAVLLVLITGGDAIAPLLTGSSRTPSQLVPPL